MGQCELRSTILDFGKRCFSLLYSHFAERSLGRDQQRYKDCVATDFAHSSVNSEVLQAPMSQACDCDNSLREIGNFALLFLQMSSRNS